MNLTDKFEKMNILCIDPSLSCTGLFSYNAMTFDRYCMSIKQKKETKKEEQLSMIYSTFMCRYSGIKGEKLAIIENYAFGAQSRSVTTCAEVGGVIRLALYHNGIPYIEIPSATWKKWAGFGKSIKKSTNKNVADYIAHGKSIYNLDYKNPDEVDATMMYVACRDFLHSVDLGLVEQKVPECLVKLVEIVSNIS